MSDSVPFSGPSRDISLEQNTQSCFLCGEVFLEPVGLVQHLLRHTGEEQQGLLNHTGVGSRLTVDQVCHVPKHVDDGVDGKVEHSHDITGKPEISSSRRSNEIGAENGIGIKTQFLHNDLSVEKESPVFERQIDKALLNHVNKDEEIFYPTIKQLYDTDEPLNVSEEFNISHSENDQKLIIKKVKAEIGDDLDRQTIGHDHLQSDDSDSNSISAQQDNKRAQEEKTKNRVYTCEVCNKSFSKRYRLKDHKYIHTGENPYTCQTCGKSFVRPSILRDHEVTHSGEKPHSCADCGKSFTALSLLKRHQQTHSGVKNYNCSYCDKSFLNGHGLRRHELTHTGEKPYKCETCGKSFARRSVLNDHVLSKHTEEKPYSCSTCGKSFIRANLLREHLFSHTGEEPYKCETCGKSFSYAAGLRNHTLTHTGEKSHSCVICGKSFALSCNLSRHMLSHTGEKRFSCETCQKSFSQVSHLRRHMTSHTEEHPYSCYTCGKSFKRDDHLKSHLLIHTGERPYKCLICEKSFSQSGSLSGHMRIHTQDKRHVCVICGRAFIQSFQLKRHMKVHDKDGLGAQLSLYLTNGVSDKLPGEQLIASSVNNATANLSQEQPSLQNESNLHENMFV